MPFSAGSQVVRSVVGSGSAVWVGEKVCLCERV